MALGWYMRRTESAEELAAFYRNVLELPLLRGQEPVFMFWAGEALVFELKSDEVPELARECDPVSASCVPVFRTRDLDALITRLADRGVRRVNAADEPPARSAYFLDADDQLIGFREYSAASMLPSEIEARRRHSEGLAYQTGCAPMPADISELGWITCRYERPDNVAAFYRDRLGLIEVPGLPDRFTFSLGDNTFVEIAGGGCARPLPKDRVEVTNSYIVRVQSTEKLKAELSDVPWPNPHIQWKRAHLCYLADPENRLVGIEERYDSSEYPPGVESFPEDIEAERRYRAIATEPRSSI